MNDPRPIAAPGAELPLVIGLGNEHRGDDAAGLWVARRLRTRLEGLGRVVEMPSDGTQLLDAWDGVGLAIVVDAVRSGRPPGTVHRIEVGSEPLPSPLGTTSTHGVSLAQAVALGQALGRRPRRLVIFGVEGARFGAGDTASSEVTAAVDRVVGEVEAEVRAATRAPAGTTGGGRRA